MEHGTSAEYHVLLRMWGRLQNDVSTQNQAHAKALRLAGARHHARA